MLFSHKYAPHDIEDMEFHQDNMNRLKKMSKDDSLSHIIFYGPAGSGKKHIISKFLEMLYDDSIYNTVDATYKISGSGNNTKFVVIKQSNYHIIINLIIKTQINISYKISSKNMLKRNPLVYSILINNSKRSSLITLITWHIMHKHRYVEI